MVKRRNAGLPYPPTTQKVLAMTIVTTLLLFVLVNANERAGVDVNVNVEESSQSPYRIVIDGGSTGSRLHIFEFQLDVTTNKTSLLRRGSTRANIPLSNFAPSSNTNSETDVNSSSSSSLSSNTVNSTHVAAHLMPLFEYATTIIPEQFHANTKVSYQATAGMRLIDPMEQTLVYNALYDGLVQHDDFKFDIQKDSIQTLSGEKEAFFGAIAANYLTGLIDVRLGMVDVVRESTEGILSSSHHDEEDGVGEMVQQGGDFNGPLGALDMGGASMQIVFLPHTEEEDEGYTNNVKTATQGKQEEKESCQNSDLIPNISNQLKGDDFFATSYLSYGADQFRERLWDTWVGEREMSLTSDPNCCEINVIYNPCAFKGYTAEWKGYNLIGTGDARACAKEINRLIPHEEGVLDENDAKQGTRTIGGVKHPALRGKFFAMSLFFFTLDCLRELSNHEALGLSWPTPSISELTSALDSLCERQWHGDLENIKDDAHDFTRAEVLPDRCFESVYIVTLLRDGFGFDLHSRDITFTFLVDGSEVEWSLGMAISSFAEESDPAVSIVGGTNDGIGEWCDDKHDGEELDDNNRTRTKVKALVRGSSWYYFYDQVLSRLYQE